MSPQDARRLVGHPDMALVRSLRAIYDTHPIVMDAACEIEHHRHEIERLRLIKHLVDELGVNLAGVQRLLSVAEVVERMRPLLYDEHAGRADARQHLAREVEALCRILGL